MLKNGLEKKECHGTISKFAENIVESIIDYVSEVVVLIFTITGQQKMAKKMQDENNLL